jgi:hypothetical protein
MERLEMWDEPHFSFCLKHHAVESDEERCRSDQRLGPFRTRAEAQSALELARRRTAAWDAEDEDAEDEQ